MQSHQMYRDPWPIYKIANRMFQDGRITVGAVTQRDVEIRPAWFIFSPRPSSLRAFARGVSTSRSSSWELQTSGRTETAKRVASRGAESGAWLRWMKVTVHVVVVSLR
jgi:hypothetical protein